jgi:hypothetical protein
MTGIVMDLKRMDTALTKAELIFHLEVEHSQAFQKGLQKSLTKQTLIDLHRLIHLGIGR